MRKAASLERCCKQRWKRVIEAGFSKFIGLLLVIVSSGA